MIGKIYRSRFPFFDTAQHKLSFKARPVLVIGQADINDLSARSYVRVHKQSVINAGDIVSPYGDLKGSYPDTYLRILAKLEVYIKNLLDIAL